MSYVLALSLYAGDADQEMLIILGIITLAVLIVLGFKFFVNLFEVITAPAASLGHHGKNDNFFFSVVVVFLGGLIGTAVLLLKKTEIVDKFHEYARGVADFAAQANPSEIYRGDAADWGFNQLSMGFDNFVVSNFIFYPVVMVIIWLLIGIFCYLFSRMFGGMCAAGDFLGSVAYGSFFFAIGLGLSFPTAVAALADPAALQPDVMGIIGVLLLIYGLVLSIIGMMQAAGLSGAQVVGVVLIMLILLGGLGYFIYSSATPLMDDFQGQISRHNPAR